MQRGWNVDHPSHGAAVRPIPYLPVEPERLAEGHQGAIFRQVEADLAGPPLTFMVKGPPPAGESGRGGEDGREHLTVGESHFDDAGAVSVLQQIQ